MDREKEIKQDNLFEIVNFNQDYWNEKIILKDLFNKSFEVRNIQDASDNDELKYSDIKQKMVDFKTNIKYNIININSINVDSLSKDRLFYLFSKPYRLSKQEHMLSLKKRITSILFFSYRKNFPNIINYNTNESFTSDCGWGCMIRSGQMILSRALYKIFRFQKCSVNQAMMYSLSLFIEYPLKVESVSDVYMPMIQKYLQTQTNDKINIVSVLPPFSIKNIVKAGGFLDKYPGEWFSDIHMGAIFSLINNYFHIIPKLKIEGMQSCLYMKNVIETCFSKHQNQEEIEYKGEKYYFEYMGFFLVSIRLGLSEISSDYFNSIKDLFKCSQCVGIIGGKNSSAYYFIGHDDEHLFYLDPHLSQNTVKELSDWESFIKKKIYKTKLESLQTAFSVGFLVRDFKDYKQLIEWVNKHQKQQFPCITLSTKVLDENIIFKNNQNEDNDF